MRKLLMAAAFSALFAAGAGCSRTKLEEGQGGAGQAGQSRLYETSPKDEQGLNQGAAPRTPADDAQSGLGDKADDSATQGQAQPNSGYQGENYKQQGTNTTR